MKNLLWKPTKISWQIHVIIAIAAIIGIIFVEAFKVNIKQPYYDQKIKAAKIMSKGMDIIKDYRHKKIKPINKKIDPLDSGMIGMQSSPITSATVDRDAKLATINPNWAAVVVAMLMKAKVKEGGTIAVSFTGSFPAINLAVLSAAKAMNLKVIIISSVASSTWGANIPKFAWLDMESLLIKEGLFSYKSVAASLGGVKDNALGMTDQGRYLLMDAIRRNGVPLIEIENVKDNISARMAIFHEKTEDTPIAAYINVGGGSVSVGTYIGKRRFTPGLNIKPPKKALITDSVITRFAKEGIPVVNMNFMELMAKKYGLPVEPKVMPKIGEGELYNKLEYNKLLVIVVLVIVLLFLVLFIRMGIGYRIFTPIKKDDKKRSPEHMV